MGASVGLAAARRGDDVVGWIMTRRRSRLRSSAGAVSAAAGLEEAVAQAELAVVAVPIAQLGATVAAVLGARGRRR